MRKIAALGLLAVMQLSAFAENGGNQITLYGNLIYDESMMPDNPVGIYETDVMMDAKVAPVATTVGKANGSAAYADGLYYAIEYTDKYGQINSCKLKTYNAETWKVVSVIDAPQTSIANTMTYNPVDKKIYGCFFNNETDKFGFGTLDVKDGSTDIIKVLDDTYSVIACNYDGTIYGIDNAGDLYRLDNSTGDAVKIGFTGFVPKNMQDATFDYGTKKMYWFAKNAETSGIYEVDITTGKATLAANFATGNKEFVGVFSKSPLYAGDVPDLPTGVSVSFVDGKLEGDLKFTMPVKTYSGDALSGRLDYYIYVDGKVVEQGSANAGDAVAEQISVEVGLHKISVSSGKDGKSGPQFYKKVYVGSDSPAAVGGIVAERNNGAISIHWDAVTESENGGPVDFSKVVYKVTRQPGNLVVAESVAETECVDANKVDKLGMYYYEVVATADGMASEVSKSNEVPIGDALELPYSKDFRKNAGLDLFTVVDANDDDCSWSSASQGARYTFSPDNAADDWLITPPLKLKAGQKYKLKSTLSIAMTPYSERFEIKCGTQPSAKAMTTTVVESMDLVDNEVYNPKEVEGYITPDADGEYFIGVHAISDAEMLYLFCYDIAVEEDNGGVSDANEEMGQIYATDGAIVVKGFDGEDISIFSIDGRLLENRRSESGSIVPVQRGSYVVKVGQSVKVVVVG